MSKIAKREEFLDMLFQGYSNRPKGLDGRPLDVDEVFSGLDLYARIILYRKYGLEDGIERTEDEIAYFFRVVDDRSDRDILWVQKIAQKAIDSIRKKFADFNQKSLIS